MNLDGGAAADPEVQMWRETVVTNTAPVDLLRLLYGAVS
jgi:hypothetical protein